MDKKKIKRFRLRGDCKPRSEKSDHLSWINRDSVSYARFTLCGDITLNIGFPDSPEKWNDFDFIIVLDEAFCQPYTPFYLYLNGEINNTFPFLEKVIIRYNEVMGQLPYLEEITG